MTKRFNSFNSLPARPEHLTKIRRALTPGRGLTVAKLQVATGLTRTQVLCAAEDLLAKGELEYNEQSKMFSCKDGGASAV